MLCAAWFFAEPAHANTSEVSEEASESASEQPAAIALPPGHPPIGGGFALPGDIRLHGRFDIAYERYGYTDNPSDGKDAFRNFHRFLILNRQAKGDPFYFNAEILGLNFFEIGMRLSGDLGSMWRLNLATGRILVPFGADPLFHHAYGGRVGFDQRFLPFVWGEYGLKATLDLDLSPVRLKVDGFIVRGQALRQSDEILNFQTNTSPLDDLKFAGGGRVSVAWGPATFNYSVYGGKLGFDRSVFMQAIDVSLWRLDLPFLRDIALTAGVLRADVFGGEADSYYHFADYIQVRYYVLNNLYLQYRGGIDMRDNRKGVFADADRLDRFDTTAHSAAVGWLVGNLSLVVQHLWQLELSDEQDDDFLRVIVTYEF